MFITLSLSYILANLQAFHFQVSSLVFLFGIIVNALLIYLVNKEKNKDLTHYLVIYLNFCSLIYGLAELLRVSFQNQVTSYFFLNFGNLGYITTPVLLFLFSLMYAKRFGFIRNKLFLTYTIVGASLLYLMGNATDLINPQSFFSFDPYLGQPPFLAQAMTNYFLIPYLLSFTVGSVVIFAIYLITQRDRSIRNQILILLLGCFVSICIGLFFMLGLKQLWDPTYGINIFPLMFTGFAVTFFIDMVRYRFLVVNPATVAVNIANTMDEMILVFNINSLQLEYINDAVIRILKYPKADLVGKSVTNIFGKNLEVVNSNIIEPLKLGKSIDSVEIELISISGEKIPVSITIKPYQNSGDNVSSMIAVATDIRQLKELSVAVSEQQKLNTIIESINDGVIALDLEGRVSMLNSSAVSLLGVAPEVLIGNRLDEIIRIQSSFNKAINISVDSLMQKKDVLENTQKIFQGEVILSYDNRSSYAVLTSAIIKDGYKVGLGSILTLLNHNEEKRLEQMEFDFVSMTVQELRAPLTMLKADTFLLEKDFQQKNNQKGLEFLIKISEITGRIVRTVENLFTVAKIEQGKIVLEELPVSIIDLIDVVLTQMEGKIKEKNISLIFSRPEEKISLVFVDKLKILEVLNNLLSNAVFFSKDGGKIVISVEQDGESVTVHIQDDGEGISQDDLPKLFDKFFRVTEKLQQGSQGLGLGLFISKSIIEMHHGKIWAESEGLDKGSTFSFSLPVKS